MICTDRLTKVLGLLLLLVMLPLGMYAQKITVKGTVSDSGGPLIGATVKVKGSSVGTVTDINGNYSLSVNSGQTLEFSYLGYNKKEIKVTSAKLNVMMEEDNKALDEVIVVGYGQQKKASVVGAITQTSGKTLERVVGVPDVATALTGNLPGVITSAQSGMPGEEEPEIVIRGTSTWNGSSPLILVDGIERPMSSVDISSIENISVLKDASATAVYGVRGANGVILITTKRGQEGRAKIDVGFNAIMKIPSKLPNKYDSYDALMARNNAVEHELSLNPSSWDFMKPQDFIENYRNQTTVEQRERYANVDWQDALFKKSAMSYHANVNVSGGTNVVRYFAGVDFQNEGDLFRTFNNDRGYDAGYKYNRINVRSNLDFNITKSTVLKLNLSGSSGQKQSPWYADGQETDWFVAQRWAGAYGIAPDVFLPQYSDGAWGFYPNASNVTNSAQSMSVGGVRKKLNTRINTDLVLEQNLDFITKGLSFRGSVSWDNAFEDTGRGVEDLWSDPQTKWINPETGEVTLKQVYENTTHFDYSQPVSWVTHGGYVNDWGTQRNLNYNLQLNWARQFKDVHNITAMGLWQRLRTATGSMIPFYREDWVFRLTYNYAGKYFIEYNGAYNGSEKFSKDNRFAFFNSGAIGWMVSEEKFWKPIQPYMDMLKLRASYGEIGDDNVNGRWLYMNQWAFQDQGTSLDVNQGTSPYHWYREASVGNPDVKWEKVKKLNFGVDFSFLGGLIVGNFDWFKDKRVDILIGGDSRSIPTFFGQTAPTANLGETTTKGYELALRFNKVLPNKMRVWAEANMTHAKNKIDIKDDPALRPAYRKDAGYAINQVRSFIDYGYLNNYDEIYGSPKHESNDGQKLPGDYFIADFNGDGKIDKDDQTPYAYSSIPENTYSATVGWEWKGISIFAQFYGVTNVTREVTLANFPSQLNTVYDQGTWWSKDNPTADVPTSRYLTTPHESAAGTRYYYDGSYIRLKNVELAYTFTQDWMKKAGFNYLRLSLSGNNLWLWTRMPDDRENSGTGGGALGAYPTVKRLNFGLRIGF